MTDTADLKTVQRMVRASGSSFYWAMRLLSRPRREAMFAIYAFCRDLDDIADGSASQAEKRAALADWRAEIAALYAGRPARPIDLPQGRAAPRRPVPDVRRRPVCGSLRGG